jgi:hypothetical protein
MANAVLETFEGRGAQITAGGNNREGIKRTYKRRFQVVLVNAADGPLGAVLSLGIPRIGDPYVSGNVADLGARCHDVSPESTDEPRQFFVVASYSSDPKDFGDPNKETKGAKDPNDPKDKDSNNPLQKPAVIEWGEGQYTEVVQKATLVQGEADGGDQDNQAVANSAGEPFDPPLEVERSFLTLTITRNQADFDPQQASGHKNAFNDDDFFGFEAGKVKCKSITARTMFEQGQSFYEVRYFFEIRESWDYVFLDAGYWEIVDGKKKEIQLKNGRPVPAPWPLNGAGHAMTEGDVQAGANLQYRTFRVADKKSFDALNLP